MEIKVLGTGCANCKTLEKGVLIAVEDLKIDAKVENIVKIMGYGIMKTPGLVIDGKVVMSGRVPSVAELKEIIAKHQ